MEIAGENDIYNNNNISLFTHTGDDQAQKTSDDATAAEAETATAGL
jgi:hypothetical protein